MFGFVVRYCRLKPALVFGLPVVAGLAALDVGR